MQRFMLAAILAAIALPAGAASLSDRYTHYYSLGDSLADPGNIASETFGLFPPPPYVDGHFSNGPTFAEYLAADFAPEDVSNYATGFARAVTPDHEVPVEYEFVQPFVAHLDDQLAQFSADAAGGGAGGALVTVLFGANDLFAIPDEVPAGFEAAAVIQAAQAVLSAVGQIASFGPAEILVSNLPDLGQIPSAMFQGPQASALASQATQLFNAVLGAGLAAIGTPVGTRVDLYDLNAGVADLIANPGAYGFDNVTTPCFPFAAPECTGFLFADGVHPTTAGHALIAAGMRAELASVAPVPLPATLPLFVLGLVSVGLVRRRL